LAAVAAAWRMLSRLRSSV